MQYDAYLRGIMVHSRSWDTLPGTNTQCCCNMKLDYIVNIIPTTCNRLYVLIANDCCLQYNQLTLCFLSFAMFAY